MPHARLSGELPSAALKLLAETFPKNHIFSAGSTTVVRIG